MKSPAFHRLSRETALAALMILQAVCAALFVVDIIADFSHLAPGEKVPAELWVELLANLGLVLAVVVEGLMLTRLLRQQARTEKALSAASGALHDLMQGYFSQWGLTAAETDVAGFTVKGFTIAEIAAMRQSAEGTVKSQLNAIYRKSGLAGRGQLVSLLIEDLLGGPLPVARPSRRAVDKSTLD